MHERRKGSLSADPLPADYIAPGWNNSPKPTTSLQLTYSVLGVCCVNQLSVFICLRYPFLIYYCLFGFCVILEIRCI